MTSSSYHDPDSLVTRPMDGLPVTVSDARRPSSARDDGSLSVGSLVSGEVLLSVGQTGSSRGRAELEFHLTPDEAAELARRLLHMGVYLLGRQKETSPGAHPL